LGIKNYVILWVNAEKPLNRVGVNLNIFKMKKLNSKSFAKFERLKLENEQTSIVRGGEKTSTLTKTYPMTGGDIRDTDAISNDDPETSTM